MAFKLITRNTVTVPVKGSMSDEQGKPERFEFTLLCKRLGVDALRDAIKADEKRTVKDFMLPVVEGWRGLLDADGVAVPFGAEALEALLDTPGVAQLAFEAYLLEQSAKAKN